MSKKFSARRVDAFFAALEATGNQTLAAERVCVSRSWVSMHRAQTPGFRDRMEAAIAKAQATLGNAPSVQPGDQSWHFQGGEELVVRGHRSGKPRICRARMDGMNPRAEKRFLAMMAASGSALYASIAAGVSPAAAYNHRERWPGFAKAWAEAEQIAVGRLEDYLVSAASELMDQCLNRPEGDYSPGDNPMTPIPPYMGVTEILDIIDRLDRRRWREKGHIVGR